MVPFITEALPGVIGNMDGIMGTKAIHGKRKIKILFMVQRNLIR